MSTPPAKQITSILVGLVVVVLIVVGGSALYRIDEAEQAVVVQLGKPVGDPVKTPGLHFKLPFIQEVRRFDKRLLAWDGDPNQVPTRGREFISVDTTARWRISDPLLFLKSLRDETGAQSRLDDIIDSVVRDKISSTPLEEIVRSADWTPPEDELETVRTAAATNLMTETEIGREQLTRDILQEAGSRLPEYGIALEDVRIKRLNYIESVREQVFNRMISERERIAAQFRSEGEGESAAIIGEMEKDLARIRSEAERKAQIIRGEGQAEATRIFNDAYEQDPEFFAFYRTLGSYEKTIRGSMHFVLGVDTDFFRYLKNSRPGGLGE